MDIWGLCQGRFSTESIHGELIRIVESQEQIATNSLVDELEEQDVLEQMLENTKPALPVNSDRLHYLLVTPFRYPPLKYGSRFSTKFEPSLFYGSHKLQTAFAETAYYRFVFWLGMIVPPASGKFITQHTCFTAEYATEMGIKLHNYPFSDFEEEIIDPKNYSSTQQLGGEMRKVGIQAFEYKSARDTANGINVAIFSTKALVSNQPLYQQLWICETNPDSVSFYSSNEGNIYRYEFNSFLVDGIFPQPSD